MFTYTSQITRKTNCNTVLDIFGIVQGVGGFGWLVFVVVLFVYLGFFCWFVVVVVVAWYFLWFGCMEFCCC